MLARNSNYRDTIYNNYVSYFQDAKKSFDPVSASKWGSAYDYYLRGWLPKEKEAVLIDLACGGGNLLYFFKQRGYSNISGLDASPEQVQLAREVISEVYEENVLDFLRTRTNSFDLMTALDIIEHFQKDEALRFLELCSGSLKRNGRLILQTANADSLWGTSGRYGDFTHEICFSVNVLLRLLKLFGFEQVEVREQGPVPWGYSLRSTTRYIIWQNIRMGLKLWNIAETGSPGSGVFTRNILASGIKK